jgi:hypothetical protein
MITNRIEVMFTHKKPGAVMFAQRGDANSRQLELVLKQWNGQLFEDIDTLGCTASVTYAYRDATDTPTTTDEMSTIRTDSGSFVTTIPTAPLARKGEVQAQVRLYKGSGPTAQVLNSVVLSISVQESITPDGTFTDQATSQLAVVLTQVTTALANVNAAIAGIPAAINAQKGLANGICPLDAQGKIPGEYIGSIEAPKYGVSGVGGSSPTLKRLWDAKGLVAGVGTDSATAVNDFDNLAPFNRRKFVGNVTVADGKTYITPAAWHGDADYTEDGSIGDYVAVRCHKTYYYQDMAAGIVGVSAYPHTGWSLHPLFIDEDGNELEYVDLPCYALALDAQSRAVSLPGLRNECGHWAGLWTSCRSYKGDAGAYASMLPIAASHYETLLAMVEFATTHLQSVMAGFTSGSYTADTPIASVLDATHIVLTEAIGGNYRAGQNVYINTTYSDAVKASHTIDSIEPCNADGSANPSGTHRKVTLTPYPGAKDITTISAPTISNRPYNTGACEGVLTPSGSPGSNTDGKFPCRYRWRENPWGNHMMTCQDLMDVRVEVAADTFKLQWYYLPKLDAYMGLAIANPSTATALTDKGWVQLATETPPDRYVDGYIKAMTPDPDHPEIWIPTLTAGASASTFFADYAYLVTSNVVRAVRVGGNWNNGSRAGPWYRYADNAPSNARAYYGAGLYFSRRGCAA